MKYIFIFLSYSVFCSILGLSLILVPIFVFDFVFSGGTDFQKSWFSIFSSGILFILSVFFIELKFGKIEMNNIFNIIFFNLKKSGLIIWLWIFFTLTINFIFEMSAVRLFNLEFDMMGFDSFLVVCVIFYGATFFLKTMNSIKPEVE